MSDKPSHRACAILQGNMREICLNNSTTTTNSPLKSSTYESSNYAARCCCPPLPKNLAVVDGGAGGRLGTRANWGALAARRPGILWPIWWCSSVAGTWCRGARAEATATSVVAMIISDYDDYCVHQVQLYC